MSGERKLCENCQFFVKAHVLDDASASIVLNGRYWGTYTEGDPAPGECRFSPSFQQVTVADWCSKHEPENHHD